MYILIPQPFAAAEQAQYSQRNKITLTAETLSAQMKI